METYPHISPSLSPHPSLPLPLSPSFSPSFPNAGKECLYLSDVFAVVPGPNRAPPRSRGPRRLSSSSIESCCEFTIHALRAVPGSPGVLTRLIFKGSKTTSVTDACEIWVQQIKHQLQSEFFSFSPIFSFFLFSYKSV